MVHIVEPNLAVMNKLITIYESIIEMISKKKTFAEVG